MGNGSIVCCGWRTVLQNILLLMRRIVCTICFSGHIVLYLTQSMQSSTQRPIIASMLFSLRFAMQRIYPNVDQLSPSHRLRVYLAASYRLCHVVGSNWIAIGDAACTFVQLYTSVNLMQDMKDQAIR